MSSVEQLTTTASATTTTTTTTTTTATTWYSFAPPPSHMALPKDVSREVDHLFIFVGGIGSRHFENPQGKFEKLRNLHYKAECLEAGFNATKDPSVPFEYDIRFIDWGTSVHDEVNDHLEQITLPGVPLLREINNNVIADVLLYMSDKYRRQILKNSSTMLNKGFAEYCAANPKFNKKNVTLIGYSLGSVILFDLLKNTEEKLERERRLAAAVPPPPAPTVSSSSTTEEAGEAVLMPSPAAENTETTTTTTESTETDEYVVAAPTSPSTYETSKPTLISNTITTTSTLETTTSATTTATTTSTSTTTTERNNNNNNSSSDSDEDFVLNFEPQNFIALGSPIGLFLTVRGQTHENFQDRHELLHNIRFYNVFHPSDLVAYRVEPLLNPKFTSVPPVQVPTFNPKKKAQPQKRASASNKQVLSTTDTTTPSSSADAAAAATTGKKGGDLDRYARIDHVLTPKHLVSAQEYIAVLTAHNQYWQNKDVAAFIMEVTQRQKIEELTSKAATYNNNNSATTTATNNTNSNSSSNNNNEKKNGIINSSSSYYYTTISNGFFSLSSS